jgi:2-phospho-L-lactate guanylyltransferase
MEVLGPAMVVPIRSFTGMTRLSGRLDPGERALLASTLAARVLQAGEEAGLEPRVVTSDAQVGAWARDRSFAVVRDPGMGLDAAADAGVRAVGNRRWLVVHADLPLADAEALSTAASILATDPVIVPSIDGGTTVIGGVGPFAFSYGPGSFHRHLARRPDAVVWIEPALTVDVDTIAHLDALATLGCMPSLRP